MDSEYEFAAAIRGMPMELVKCETNDLLVPADAEIVLEGEISTTEVKEEGPFGEFMGYHEESMLLNTFKVNCISRRKDAYYMMTIEGPELGDAENVTSTSHNANFVVAARERIIGYRDSWLPGAGRAHMAIVSIKKGLPGWGKMAIYQSFAVPYVATMVNVVIVVDEDIDPSNNEQVLWALATRVDAAQDIIITPYMGAYALNPAASKREKKYSRTGVTDFSMVAKLGIDATLKTPEEGRERPAARILKPKQELHEMVLKKWKKYGLS
jgi:4-hydroxy-3-polyprenylbenzoate decarboxylase